MVVTVETKDRFTLLLMRVLCFVFSRLQWRSMYTASGTAASPNFHYIVDHFSKSYKYEFRGEGAMNYILAKIFRQNIL